MDRRAYQARADVDDILWDQEDQSIHLSGD